MPNPDVDKRRTTLLRLLAGLDFYRDWHIACVSQARGPDYIPDMNEFVEPGQAWLDRFDAQPEHSDFWLQCVKDWYAHTSNELIHVRLKGNPTDRDAVETFLSDFRKRFGFDFVSIGPQLDRMAAKALKQGKVASRNEYDQLAEYCMDASQTNLGKADIERLGVILSAFRDSA